MSFDPRTLVVEAKFDVRFFQTVSEERLLSRIAVDDGAELS